MQPLHTTLYELVEAVAEFAANERELAAVVAHVLATHRARRGAVPRSALS
jgi:hypothetical protein